MGLSGHADPAAVLGVTISFTIIAAAAVLLRMYSRIFIVHSPGKDDAFIVAASTMTVCLTIAQGFQVKYGMGRHISTLSDAQIASSLKPFWASVIIYNLALFMTKFSILLQYLRIFPYRLFRILCLSLMAFIFAWSCWTITGAIFFCRPVEFFWDKTIPNGQCFSRWAVWFSNAAVNIITDILVATLPLPFLNQLQLPKRQRIALMIVFALGGFTCIISILRLQSLLVLLQTTDYSYHNQLAAIWSNLEVNIGITCSCLPTLKAMATRWFPGAFGSSYHLRGSDQSQERRICGNPEDHVSSKKTIAGASSRASCNPVASGKHKTPPSFYSEAFTRGPGRELATHKTTIHSSPREQNERRPWARNGRADDSVEEIELDALRDTSGSVGTQEQDQHGIQVVTVVEQEVEKGYVVGGGGGGRGGEDAKSEAGSERELIATGGKRGRFA